AEIPMFRMLVRGIIGLAPCNARVMDKWLPLAGQYPNYTTTILRNEEWTVGAIAILLEQVRANFRDTIRRKRLFL
ncbi:hypothetical protein, partial [Allocoleopsis sp.]|uniref:hypothetical protein n=1 Tax=Allocoleopsis sp. TaxID=3088169 RepID=UPI002FCFE725